MIYGKYDFLNVCFLSLFLVNCAYLLVFAVLDELFRQNIHQTYSRVTFCQCSSRLSMANHVLQSQMEPSNSR